MDTVSKGKKFRTLVGKILKDEPILIGKENSAQRTDTICLLYSRPIPLVSFSLECMYHVQFMTYRKEF